MLHFFKTQGHVMDMAKTVTFPLPLLATAYQQLIHGMLTASLHVNYFLPKWALSGIWQYTRQHSLMLGVKGFK
jgi:hypothetical protein